MVFSRTISLSDGENPGFYLFCPSSFTLSSKIKVSIVVKLWRVAGFGRWPDA